MLLVTDLSINQAIDNAGKIAHFVLLRAHRVK
jgi:hypothetical protein